MEFGHAGTNVQVRVCMQESRRHPMPVWTQIAAVFSYSVTCVLHIHTVGGTDGA